MKIFLTGAAGYIGGSIAEKLALSGHEVMGLPGRRSRFRRSKREGSTPSSVHWTIPRF